MFKKIWNVLEKIDQRLFCVGQMAEQTKERLDSLVECGTCGCLLHRETAVKGRSTIETKREIPKGAQWPVMEDKEIVVPHYYCNVHKPREK